MRTLVIPDIHGEEERLKAVLDKASYNSELDRLIQLGDLVDRGKNSRQVVEFFMNLKDKYHPKVILIKGNHEDMFLDWLEDDSEEFEEWYFHNGGRTTVESFCEPFGGFATTGEARIIILANYQKHIEFLRNMQDWEEEEKHIYVHAGVDLITGNWKSSSEFHLRRDRKIFFNERNKTGKAIIFGHTMTKKLNKDGSRTVWFNEADGKIGLDGGAVDGGPMHCLEISPWGYKVYSA